MFRKFAAVAIGVGLSALFVACSGGNESGTDAGSHDSSVITDATIDTGTKKDTAPPPDVGVTCTAETSYTSVTNQRMGYTPTPTDGGVDAGFDAGADAGDEAGADGGADASTDGGTGGGTIGGLKDEYLYLGDLNTDIDQLDIEIYAGYGAFTNGVTTGAVTLSGAELNYATCGLCLLVFTDTAGTNYADTYMATGGSVTITSLVPTGTSPHMTGTLTNVTLTHVDIDPSTFESTPVGDGCDISIKSLNISASIKTN